MNPSGAPWNNCRAVVAGLALVVLCLVMLPPVAGAEEFEATHCYGGTYTAFHGSQELKYVLDWQASGIVRSDHKMLDKASTHVVGVERGGTPQEGYLLGKLVDGDGDIIIWGDHYAGTKYQLRFLEGTGKWKGLTGGFESAVVASSPKGAMPNSFHGCNQWKGTLVRK